MFCTNCGTQFEGKFCPACGTPAVAGPIVPVAPPEASGGEPPRFTCCGVYKVLGGSFEVKPDCIIINRSFLTQKFYQEIPIDDIIGVQFANATFTQNGFIHFVTRANSAVTILDARQATRDFYSAAFNLRSNPISQVAQEIAKICNARANNKT